MQAFHHLRGTMEELGIDKEDLLILRRGLE